MSNQSNPQTDFQTVITKAWSDPEYKERLLRDPKRVLAESGIRMPENVNIQVHANRDEVVHLVLPASPAGEALSAAELEQVAGGTFTINIGGCIYTYIAGCRTVGEECAP